MTSSTDTKRVTLEVVTRPAELETPRRVPDPLSYGGRSTGRPATWQKYATSTDDDGWEHYAWTVRLNCDGRSMESPWRAGIANVTKGRRLHYPGETMLKPNEPTARDILESLFLDASSYDSARGFEDFASDFGYDTDSRKAEELYRTCGRLAEELARLIGGRPWQDEPAEELAERYTQEEVTP